MILQFVGKKDCFMNFYAAQIIGYIEWNHTVLVMTLIDDESFCFFRYRWYSREHQVFEKSAGFGYQQ